MSYFPINDFVGNALRGTADRVSFAEQRDGSYKSTVFIASDALQDTISKALAPYGITPTISHDQTHRKIRRIALSVSAQEMQNAAAAYTTNVLSRLQEITGQEWSYEPERRAYLSEFCKIGVARSVEERLNTQGLNDSHTHNLQLHDDDDSTRRLSQIAQERGVEMHEDTHIIEAPQSYVAVWMAKSLKAEQVGPANERQGAARG